MGGLRVRQLPQIGVDALFGEFIFTFLFDAIALFKRLRNFVASFIKKVKIMFTVTFSNEEAIAKRLPIYKTLDVNERINFKSNLRFKTNRLIWAIIGSTESPTFGGHLWKGLSATAQPYFG